MKRMNEKQDGGNRDFLASNGGNLEGNLDFLCCKIMKRMDEKQDGGNRDFSASNGGNWEGYLDFLCCKK